VQKASAEGIYSSNIFFKKVSGIENLEKKCYNDEKNKKSPSVRYCS
jgi:hypothetical protein